MSFRDELKLLFDARIAVVNLVPSEEARILREVTDLVKGPDWSEDNGLYTWDIADQFTCLKPARVRFDDQREITPDTIPRMVRDYPGGATFILKDFHQVWEAKRGASRALRNLAASLSERSPRKDIVITTPESCLPVELKHDVPVLELAKPDAREMDALLERAVGGKGAPRGVKPIPRAKRVEAALGLTSTQARRVFQKAVISNRGGSLDESCIDLIAEEKRAIIRASGALELYPHVERADPVGGLKALKRRSRILDAHLKQKGLTMIRRRFDPPAVARATGGFVGAELEASVKGPVSGVYGRPARNRRRRSDPRRRRHGLPGQVPPRTDREAVPAGGRAGRPAMPPSAPPPTKSQSSGCVASGCWIHEGHSFSTRGGATGHPFPFLSTVVM